MFLIYTGLCGSDILMPYKICGNVECFYRVFGKIHHLVNHYKFGGLDMTFATGLAIVGTVAGIILLVTVKDLMSES